MINVQYGPLLIENNQLKIWDKQGNLLSIFDLFDKNGAASMTSVYRREVI